MSVEKLSGSWDETSNTLPQPFLDAQNWTKDCCAQCLWRWDVDTVSWYVTCENANSPNSWRQCAPDSQCDKFSRDIDF